MFICLVIVDLHRTVAVANADDYICWCTYTCTGDITTYLDNIAFVKKKKKTKERKKERKKKKKKKSKVSKQE